MNNGLEDGQGTAPANFDDLNSSAACQTNCVANSGESNKAPVLPVATGQNFTSNWYAGESAGREETLCQFEERMISQGTGRDSPKAHYSVGGSVITTIIFGLA